MIPEIELMRAQELSLAASMVKPLAIILIGGFLVIFPAFVCLANARLEYFRKRKVSPQRRQLDSEALAYKLGLIDAEKRAEKRRAQLNPRREKIAA